MRIKLDLKPDRPPTTYELIIGLIGGLLFLGFGTYSLIQNLPNLSNFKPVTYTFHANYGSSAELHSNFGRYDRTWQVIFPSYSKLVFPFVFILGGLLILSSLSKKTRRFKILFTGLFTLSLGIVLTYFFQFNFPIVIIPLIFVVIGIFIILIFLFTLFKKT